MDPDDVLTGARKVRPPFEELGSRRPNHEQRHVGPFSSELLEECEHRLVRPMKVLEDEYRRPHCSEDLEEPAPGGELLVAPGSRARSDPDERKEPLPEPGALVAVGQDVVELRDGDRRRVRLEDPGLALDDLAERPERDRRAVGEAAALAPCDEDRVGIDVGQELRHEAALAEAWLADDRRELEAPPGDRSIERCHERVELQRAPHERARLSGRDVDAEGRPGGDGVEHADRLGLAFQCGRRELRVVEPLPRRPPRLLAHGDAEFGRDRLDPRGRVDAVAGKEPLPCPGREIQPNERLTGVDADFEYGAGRHATLGDRRPPRRS